MTRLTRLVLVFGSVFGFLTVPAAPSQAGVIPWTYNAIFGPVGSMRYGSGYSGMYGARNYTGYAPVSYGYVAPAAYVSSPIPSYGGGGCSSCNQSSYYPPAINDGAFYGSYPSSPCGCQPCNNCCPGGNCSNGSGCSNCSANLPPLPNGTGATGTGSNTSGYGPSPIAGPVPDPNNTRDVNTRMIEIENRVNRDEHRWNEIERFLKKFHKNDYQPAPYSGSGGSEIVPQRHNTFESNESNPDNFPLPRTRKPRDVNEPIEGDEARKPEIPVPAVDEKSDGQEKTGSSAFKETEPQTLRVLDRVTTQAVAPRSRMLIVTKQQKAAIAKSNKSQSQPFEKPRLPELARN